MIQFKQAPASAGNGTYLQDYVDTSYRHIVAVFGQPHTNGDGYKVDAEWVLEFEDGTIATIYNYKTGKNYDIQEGKAVKDIRDWHIGGTSKRAVECVMEVLNSAPAQAYQYEIDVYEGYRPSQELLVGLLRRCLDDKYGLTNKELISEIESLINALDKAAK